MFLGVDTTLEDKQLAIGTELDEVNKHLSPDQEQARSIKAMISKTNLALKRSYDEEDARQLAILSCKEGLSYLLGRESDISYIANPSSVYRLFLRATRTIQASSRMAFIRHQFSLLKSHSGIENIPCLFPFFKLAELQKLQSVFRRILLLQNIQMVRLKSSVLQSAIKRLIADVRYRNKIRSSLLLLACILRNNTLSMSHVSKSARTLQAECRCLQFRSIYIDVIKCGKHLCCTIRRCYEQKKWIEMVLAGMLLSMSAKRAILRCIFGTKRQAAQFLQAVTKRKICSSMQLLKESATTLFASILQANFRTKWLAVKEAVSILSESMVRCVAYHAWKMQQPSEIRRRAAAYLLDVSQAKLCKNLYVSQLTLHKKIQRIQFLIQDQAQQQTMHVRVSISKTAEIREMRRILHELRQELAALVEDPIWVSWIANSMCRTREALLSILQKQLNHVRKLGELEEAALKNIDTNKSIKMEDIENEQEDRVRAESHMLVLSNSLSMEHPDDPRIEQAVRLEADRQYSEAILLLTQSIQDTKFRLFVFLKRAVCFNSLGMRADAIKDLVSAIHEFPMDWRAYFFRALLFTQMGYTVEALDNLSSSLKFNPNLAVGYVLRANISLEEGRFTDAILDLNLAVKLRYDDSALYFLRGKAFKKLGKSLLSAYDYERATSIHIERFSQQQESKNSEHNKLIRRMRLACTDQILIDMCFSFLETDHADLAIKILNDTLSVDASRAVAYSLLGHVKSFKGEFEDAEKDIERALVEDSSNSYVHLFKSLFYRNIDPSSSLLDLKQSLELDERNAKANFVMAKFSETQQDWQGALKAYRSAMAEDDDDAQHLEASIRYSEISLQVAGADFSLRNTAFKNLMIASVRHAPSLEPLIVSARLYARFGEYSKAIKAVCRAIHLFPCEITLYTLRSRLLTESAHFREGNRDCLRGLFLQDTKDLLICKRIAQVKIRLGMNQEAKTYLEGLLLQNPKNADFECLLGSVYFNLGDVKRAFQHLSEAIRIEPFSGQHFGARAKVFAHEREFPKAIADYSNALKVNRMETDFFYGRAVCFFETGKEDEAVQDLDAVIAQDPNHTQARLLRGMLLEKSGQRTMACADYDHALEFLHSNRRKLPASASSLGAENQLSLKQLRHHVFLLCIRRGALLSRRKQYAAAIQDYNDALKIDPNCEIALLQRGNAYHLHGYFASACVDYSKVLSIDPSNELARKNRALVKMALKKWNESLEDFACIPEVKRDAQTWLSLVDCYRAMKDITNALFAAEKALMLASNAMSFHGFIGLNKLLTRCLVTKGDVEEVAFPRSRATLKTLVRAVHLLPTSSFARLKLAFALFGRGSFLQAAAQLKIVRISEPGNSMAAELAAIIHAEIGNLHVACGRLDHLILNEQSTLGRAQLISSRGVIHHRLQDLPHAEHDYWQSSRIVSETSETHYNLGCLHMQREDWFLAKMAFDRAISAKPTNDLAYLNRSVVYFHLGHPDIALSDLHNALKISPGLGQAYLNRAIIRSVLGQPDEAEKDLGKAVQLLMGQDGQSAQVSIVETRHVLNRDRGSAIDTLVEYAGLTAPSYFEGGDLFVQYSDRQNSTGDVPQRSLWFKCLIGEVEL